MKEKTRNAIKFGIGLAVGVGVVRATRAFMPFYPSLYDWITIGTAGVIFGVASQDLVADQVDKCIEFVEDVINGNTTNTIVM